MPDSYSLSILQRIVVQAAKAGTPQINRSEIGRFISNLQFPLYFLDFETYASAIPLIDGTSPHGAFPVQYSLHILDESSSLTHKEFLEHEPRLPRRLIEQMYLDIGNQGSLVSSHASFEKKQNRTMADMFPDKAKFLADMKSRMVDLEDLFKTAYVDVRFEESSSIKKVLPVVYPHLNYEGLDIQDGGSAMEAKPEKDWLDHARRAISRYDLFMVMLGPHRRKANGVLKELTVAIEKKKPRFQIIGYKDDSTDWAIQGGGRTYRWNWDNLKKLLA